PRSHYHLPLFPLLVPCAPLYTLFPYTTLFRSRGRVRRRAPDEFSDRSGSCVVLQYLQQRFARAMHAHLQRRDALAGHSGHLLIRSEEHTSELQSRFDLVCRLLLEKNNTKTPTS